jgi:hypothetical protein
MVTDTDKMEALSMTQIPADYGQKDFQHPGNPSVA